MGADRPRGQDQGSDLTPETRTARSQAAFGRRRGRPLRPGRQRLLDESLSRIEIPLSGQAIDPRTLFEPAIEQIWLEIGFGAGEHLAWHAGRNPNVGFIGCEYFESGVASLLAHVQDGALRNVRIHMGDALDLLPTLPSASLDRVFILHPDPWRKRRHHKRRIVRSDVLALLHDRMREGSELRIATDHIGYLRWILRTMAAEPRFRWTARRSADWLTRPDDWPETRYEAKAKREGRRAFYLTYRRAGSDVTSGRASDIPGTLPG